MPTAPTPAPTAGSTQASSPSSDFSAYNKMVGDWLAAHPGQAFTAHETPEFWNSLFALGSNQQGLPQLAYGNATLNDVAAGQIIPYSQLPGGPNYNAATFPVHPTDPLAGNFPFAMPEAQAAPAGPPAGTVAAAKPGGKPAGSSATGTAGGVTGAPEFLRRALMAPGMDDVIRKLFAQ